MNGKIKKIIKLRETKQRLDKVLAILKKINQKHHGEI